MNYNIITYLIYTPIIVFITVRVGYLFYKNGEIFLHSILTYDVEMVKRINKLLLVGYYLLNIGYAIITIAYWQKITNLLDIINTLTYTLGKLIIILSLMHYNNIFWIKKLIKNKSF